MASDGTMYGRAEEEWTTLIDGCGRFLRERAALARTTNYTEVNQTLERRYRARRFDFDLESERAAMGHLLGRVVDEEYDSTGLMLSAIVLYLNENDAGPGFFTKAVEVRLLDATASATQRQTFWVEQVTAVHEHYRAERRPRTGGSRSAEDPQT